MKLIEIQSGLLTNEEVLTHIIDVRAKNEDKLEFKRTKNSIRESDGTTVQRLNGKLKELNYMCDDIIKHFAHSDSPLSQTAQNPHSSTQSRSGAQKHAATSSSKNRSHANTPMAKTAELIQHLKPFNLTKSEVLMLANHRPRNETVLEPLIEEVEERFSAEQQEEVLRIVSEVYGLPDVEG